MKHVRTISQPKSAVIGPGLTFWQQLVAFITKGKIIPL